MGNEDLASAVATYDRSAIKLAKNIAVTRTVSSERIAQLSGLVRQNAAELTAKAIEASAFSHIRCVKC